MIDQRFEDWWTRNPARAELNPVAKEVARTVWHAAQNDLVSQLHSRPVLFDQAPVGGEDDTIPLAQPRTYIDPRKDALWYPDDSGEWVEVPDDCMACPVPEDTVVGYLLRREREWKDYCAYPNTASDVCWDLDPEENERIVAYKVVKP